MKEWEGSEGGGFGEELDFKPHRPSQRGYKWTWLILHVDSYVSYVSYLHPF